MKKVLVFLLTLAVLAMLTSAIATKNCKKGKRCGNTCININYTCHVGSGGSVSILGGTVKGAPKPIPTGQQSLLDAAQMGMLRQVRILINAGADLNQTNIHRETPLMLAIRDNPNGVEIAKLFLWHQNCDLNMISRSGQTALSLAKARGDSSLIAFLMMAGARDIERNRGAPHEAEARAPPAEAAAVPAYCININTASREELKEIIHIDEERSGQILELRPFIHCQLYEKGGGAHTGM